MKKSWQKTKKELIQHLLNEATSREVSFYDPLLSARGWTTIWQDSPGEEYRIFSHAPGWEDQVATTWHRKQLEKYLYRVPIKYLREALEPPQY